MTKRIISLLLVLVMVISMLPARAVAVGWESAVSKAADQETVLESILEQPVEGTAEPTVPEATSVENHQPVIPEALPEVEPEIILTDTEGDYTYTVSSDNTATITGYSGTDTELVIPDTLGGYPVTDIGRAAFRDCTGLTSLTIPEGVVTIGQYAFRGCTALTSIEIPESVTSLGDNAFYNCTGITEIILPAGAANGAGSSIFSGCGNLTKITLAEGTTAIPEGMLRDLKTQFNLIIPSTVTAIGASAFRDCTGLTSFTIPEGVVSIGQYAFRGCTALTSIEIPESVTNLGDNAFYNCTGITEIILPAGAANGAGSSIFSGCGNLTKITLAEGTTAIPEGMLRDLKTQFNLIIPSTVTAIGASAFRDCTGLTSLTIPEGVVTIGQYAFRGCTALTSIEIPESITSLGDNAFYNCTGITEITLPAGAANGAGSSIFSGCGNLTKITLAEGTTIIPEEMLRRLTTDFEVVIPETVTTIGMAAFQDCTGLTGIYLPESVTVIEPLAFDGCSSLVSIVIPTQVTSLKYAVFADCASLTEMELHEGITSLGKQAFAGCTNLESVTIPWTVNSIGESVFQNCPKLQTAGPTGSGCNIEFGWGRWIPSQAFHGCNYLTGVAIPDTIEAIYSEAFEECTRLTAVTLPDSVITVNDEAFYGCTSLRTVVIPRTTTSIGMDVFYKCPNLRISCPADSRAFSEAIYESVPVDVNDWTLPEPEILSAEGSYYETNSGGAGASGYVDLVLHYELREDLTKLPDIMYLKILFPAELVVLENSLRLDGKIPEDYLYLNNRELSVWVTEPSGTLRFSVKPTGAFDLLTQAKLYYTYHDETKQDMIGCMASEMQVLSLITDDSTNTPTIRVSGVAPAQAGLTLYIDSTAVATATASKAGYYKTELTIPDAREGETYTVRAVVDDVGTTAEKCVTYDLNAPVLEELLLCYSGHDQWLRYYEYAVDLTDPQSASRVISFNPRYQYTFRVKMSNPEMVSSLYITSTRLGQTKYVEARYDEQTGYFVTFEPFDNADSSYVPGEFGILCERKYPELDNRDPELAAEALIDDADGQYDLNELPVTVGQNDDTNLIADMQMLNGDTVHYEYHQYTAQELYDFLVGQQIVDEAEPGQLQPQGVIGDNLGDLLKEYLEYFVQDGKKHYLGLEDDQYILVSPGETGSADDVWSVWLMKTSGQRLIDGLMLPETASGEEVFKTFVGDATATGRFSTGGFLIDGTSAVYKFGDRMWQLHLAKEGATAEELAEIERTERLLGGVLVSRLVVAGIKSSTALMPPGVGLVVGIAAFLAEDYLDSVEQTGSWVQGFENSIIGLIMIAPENIWGLFINIIQSTMRWIIDPSGYVYEAVTTNRLSGVTATVYYQDPETGEAILWDAGEYDQINPIITGPDGVYAWDVPEGLWQVKYELDGYETVYSDWMPVPPPQTDVNVGMVSYDVPEAQWIDVYHDSVEIEFSKYMIPDTVDDITLTDAEGSEIAYTLEYSTDETAADGTVYAKKFTLEFDSAFLNHGETCVITIPGGVKSYAGISIEAAAITRICTEQIVISAPDRVTVPYGEQAVISVGLSVKGFENIEVISMFSELAQVDAIEKTENGWDITVTGNLPGRTALLITIPETSVSKYVEVVIDAFDGAHTHDYSAEVTTEPTCTESGVKTWTCEICGEQYTEMIPALGHSFGNWIVIQEPTTAEEGLEERSCAICGHTEQRTISKLENPFSDVAPGSFYYEPVMWAIENGITNGTSATTFGPNDQCMRAHVVTFLWRAVGSPEPERMDNPFEDVKSSDFYYKAVLWAVENGITNGLDATHFGPTAYCNRAQVVTFLYRTMGSPDVETAFNPFTDVVPGSFYEKPVLWAVENGITNGLSATSFGPNTICNRAQIVTFLYRAFVND